MKKSIRTLGALAMLTLASGLASVPALAGAAGGPRTEAGYLLCFDFESHFVTFDSLEWAEVEAIAATDVDIFVYDSDGDLVASDVLANHNPICSWIPIWDEVYEIVIQNADCDATSYVLMTN